MMSPKSSHEAEQEAQEASMQVRFTSFRLSSESLASH
jgi:hypothetical protein